MACGLTMTETMDLPFGELQDLIAVYQVKHEGAKPKHVLTDEDIIPDVL